MIHPLVQLLITQPELLAQHLSAYAALMGVEATEVMRLARRRVVLGLVLIASVMLGLGLSGVAVMLLAVVPLGQMPWPWLLITAPAVAWLLALACWWRLHVAMPVGTFAALRQQLDLDAALLRQVQPS